MKMFNLAIGDLSYIFHRFKKKRMFFIREGEDTGFPDELKARLIDTGNGIQLYDKHLNNGVELDIPYHTAARIAFLLSQIEEGQLPIRKQLKGK